MNAEGWGPTGPHHSGDRAAGTALRRSCNTLAASVLCACLVCGAAHGQDDACFFPCDVGDRWRLDHVAGAEIQVDVGGVEITAETPFAGVTRDTALYNGRWRDVFGGDGPLYQKWLLQGQTGLFSSMSVPDVVVTGLTATRKARWGQPDTLLVRCTPQGMMLRGVARTTPDPTLNKWVLYSRDILLWPSPWAGPEGIELPDDEFYRASSAAAIRPDPEQPDLIDQRHAHLTASWGPGPYLVLRLSGSIAAGSNSVQWWLQGIGPVYISLSTDRADMLGVHLAMREATIQGRSIRGRETSVPTTSWGASKSADRGGTTAR